MRRPRKYPKNIIRAVDENGRVIEFDPPVNVYEAAAKALAK
jgi:hypothetical protein